MKSHIVSSLMVALAPTLAFAAPADHVRAAVQKLSDAPNYSWSTSISGGGRFGGGAVSGVAEKDGYAVISRRTPNGEFKTVLKGENAVSELQGGWMTREELRARFQGGGGGGGPRGGFRGLGGNQRLPATELNAIIAGVTEFTVAEGVYTAEISGDAVIPNFGRGFGNRNGQRGPAARNASGSIKIWISDGVVSKYELHITGSVTTRNGDERSIDRTTTTEISHVGSTTVEVPAEAKARLG